MQVDGPVRRGGTGCVNPTGLWGWLRSAFPLSGAVSKSVVITSGIDSVSSDSDQILQASRDTMKAILLALFCGLMGTALLLPLGADLARAQAPAGPQGGTQGTGAQPTPPPAPTTAAPQQQKPQDAGASIAVEVPVVTLDVIATTKNGDLLTGLKKENFRIVDEGQPQTITNF